MGDNNLVVVGVGIDGLMMALKAHQAGQKVQVLAKGPDPRGIVDAGEHFAATYNGQETRYVTPYEGHPYLGNTPMYPDMGEAFSKSYDQGGWLGKNPEQYSTREQKWLHKRGKVNGDEGFKSDAFRWYVEANLAAMEEWQSLRDWHPELFKGAEIKDDIVRVYDNRELYDWAKELHQKDGVLQKATEGDEITKDYPHLKEAHENGVISGVLRINGFSIDAQRFCRNVINYLEENGVEFHFNTEVTKLERNNEGQVTGLISRDSRFEADNYSLHMGAYDTKNILKNTAAEDTIAGMEGRWVRMAVPEGMRHSIKIHGDTRKNQAVTDQNHALAGDETIIGYGYLFAGFNPDGVDSVLREQCDENNLDLIGEFFPTHTRDSEAEQIAQGCVRSWTYDDLPRADVVATNTGGVLLVCGGGNTGSFTQAPAQAENNLSRLREEANASISQLLQLHEQSECLAR